MNIDEKIQQELKGEADKLDAILAKEPGVFGLLNNSYHGAMRFWIALVFVITLAATVALVWCGYQFFQAEGIEQQIFWGVWFIISLFVQAMLKLWTFMEMNRSSVIREVKRVELAIERLTNAVSR